MPTQKVYHKFEKLQLFCCKKKKSRKSAPFLILLSPVSEFGNDLCDKSLDSSSINNGYFSVFAYVRSFQ